MFSVELLSSCKGWLGGDDAGRAVSPREFAPPARRAGWQVATGVLSATYLAVWLAFGVAAYLGYVALRMRWANQRLLGGASLVLAGLYAFTPFKRSSEARCRELCALHGPLPFNLQRSAVLVGARYGVRCVGCSAALMVAAVLIGMSSLGWMAILGGLVLLYKLAPVSGRGQGTALAVAVVALGVLYAFGG